jgi:hypothetical protein
MQDRFTSAIKKPKPGKEGYADTLKTKVATNQEGEVTTEFFDPKADPISHRECTPGSEVVGIIQLRNVYMTGKNYGPSWRTEQGKVYPPTALKGYSIKDDDEEMKDAQGEEGEDTEGEGDGYGSN